MGVSTEWPMIWFAVRVNLVCTFSCMLFPFRLQVGTDGSLINKFAKRSNTLETEPMLQLWVRSDVRTQISLLTFSQTLEIMGTCQHCLGDDKERRPSTYQNMDETPTPIGVATFDTDLCAPVSHQIPIPWATVGGYLDPSGPKRATSTNPAHAQPMYFVPPSSPNLNAMYHDPRVGAQVPLLGPRQVTPQPPDSYMFPGNFSTPSVCCL